MLFIYDSLENASKERIDTSTFTVEHVMPQNVELRPEWRAMLGPDWKAVHETWLHRLGNLTLTGYNTTYSDRPFHEKKTVEKGFDESPLRLNKFIREQETWTSKEMEHRGKLLANKAVEVWPSLAVDPKAVKQAELSERIALAAQFSTDRLPMDAVARSLFAASRAHLMAFGDNITELCAAGSVTYRVFDFFVEVIPRKSRLTLLFNLDYEDCVDPSGKARDTREMAFILNATEHGGVLYDIKSDEDFPAALAIAKQAYESVAE